MEIKVIRTNENAKIPTRGSEQAAGLDLCACLDDYIVIKPFETVMVGTGIAMEIPRGYFGAVYARSGLATKEGVRPANCVGIIDADYRGELKVPLHNDNERKAVIIEPGERIAQLVIQPYAHANLRVVASLEDTARGEGGFGSTGKK